MHGPDTNLLTGLSLEKHGARPLYAQLKDELRALVDTHFGDGDLFYSQKTLIERLPISQITIRRALSELTAEGLLVPGRGQGTTIRKSNPPARPAQRQGNLAGRVLGIILAQTLLSLSEHSRALMLEFQRQGAARGVEVRFHEAADTTRLSQVFRSVSGGREEEAFVLFTPSDLTHLLYHALANRGCRSVAMEGVSPDHPGWVVATDAAAAVRIGLEHLQSLGHRHVVLLVNEPATEYNVQDKIRAFERSVAELGLDPLCRVVLCDNFIGGDSYSAAYDHVEEALGGPPERPTAIFTVSDAGAWAAIRWCLRHGLRVPEEVSVLGFEDAGSNHYFCPAISSVAHPDTQLVRTTLDVLWGGAEGGARKILIPPTLVARESTGPAPGAGGAG